MKNQKRYEIGGVCVWMTSEQAAYWNESPLDWDWNYLKGATVYVPRRDSHNHPYEDSFSLKDVVEKDIENMYSQLMVDCPANETN